MKAKDIVFIFAKNYLQCDKALNSTECEPIKLGLQSRISQIVLMYSEIFSMSIFEAEKELKFFVFSEDSE